MPPRKNLTGQRFGRLVVVRFSHVENGSAKHLCRCDCGQERIISSSTLGARIVVSCGCYGRALLVGNRLTLKHGQARNGARSRAYVCWQAMIQRCTNPRHKAFHRYGGRGIVVCDRWLHSFENFYADMGDPPPNLSLERRDNEAGYNSENCYWATRKAQGSNQTRWNEFKSLKVAHPEPLKEEVGL